MIYIGGAESFSGKTDKADLDTGNEAWVAMWLRGKEGSESSGRWYQPPRALDVARKLLVISIALAVLQTVAGFIFLVSNPLATPTGVEGAAYTLYPFRAYIIAKLVLTIILINTYRDLRYPTHRHQQLAVIVLIVTPIIFLLLDQGLWILYPWIPLTSAKLAPALWNVAPEVVD